MKSFAQYLVETRQTFDYRIKILGDCEPELINALEEKLQQFDVVKMTEPKKTPIQKVLADFPDAENDSCTFMDVTFNYPATPPQITQIAELLGINPNHIIMQLRKSVSMNGQKNVEFASGTQKVPATIAQKVLDMYNKQRTSSDKSKFQMKIAKSYKDLLTTVKGR